MAKSKGKAVLKNNELKQEVKALQNKVAQLSVKPSSVKKARKKAKKVKNNILAGKQPFGPISTISTAPVAIGNSVKGSSKRLIKTSNGVRIIGRDFMFSPVGTKASITSWCMVGGSPLTPAAFTDSVIANYMRLYMKFKFHSVTVHFITSSPTSAPGDIMFYYSKDRSSVFVNQTSPQLLPFVFTDENTVLGPQWTNHSARFNVTGDWKLNDYGMHDGIEEYADGEMFLLSKTANTEAPGYVIFDYDIEFAAENLQPRLLSFPIPKIQWYSTSYGTAGGTVVAGGGTIALTLRGKNISDVDSTVTPGSDTGDVFKVIFDITNSTLPTQSAGTAPTWSNLFQLVSGGGGNSLTLSDGFTCYAVQSTTGSLWLYQNATTAYAQSSPIQWALSCTFNEWSVKLWISFVGSLDNQANVSNF